MRHVVPISGKDSATLALRLRETKPKMRPQYIYNETGAELPPTLEWLSKMEQALGKKIKRIGANLEDIIEEQGMLPGMRMRFCTRLAKIYPMEDMYKSATKGVTLYLGIRADENRTGYEPSNKTTAHIKAVYPLKEWGMGLQEVWTYLEGFDLLPPAYHWQAMEDLVRKKLGSFAGLLDTLPAWERRMLLAWRSRDNCYFCFFQRAYEWIGLHDHYPDLFSRAGQIEQERTDDYIMYNGGGKGFTWRSDGSLPDLLTRRDKIIDNRAKKIARYLFAKAQIKFDMFDLEDDTETPDLLQVVSCGLFCGK